jgi:hypothetical protein
MKQEDWILKERELYPPLKEWLNGQGYKAYTEILNMDVVAKKDNEFIGFELKMSCSKTVIHQAYRTMTLCGKAYIVTPVIPRINSFDECKKRGIGIMRITDNIDILLEAGQWEHRLIYYYFKIGDFEQMQEGQISGTPNMKGEGPAQCLLKEIQKYLELNPKAGWEQIYNNVPNHYSNYRSLANSMRSWQGFTLR